MMVQEELELYSIKYKIYEDEDTGSETWRGIKGL